MIEVFSVFLDFVRIDVWLLGVVGGGARPRPAPAAAAVAAAAAAAAPAAVAAAVAVWPYSRRAVQPFVRI